jgi:hypothetical protein
LKYFFKNKMQPRLIRQVDAPSYLGFSEPEFNKRVRPFVTEIKTGRMVSYDRLDLDAWADEYKRANGRPGKEILWQNVPPASERRATFGKSKKVIAGQLIRVSTGETDLEQAEKFLAHLTEERRKILIYGDRVERTFNQAAARYVEESKKKIDRPRYR